ncbi:MAG: mechanosensitive ion channel [Anaerolineae bacterium]|nr:mechanosensitive ion channel [Anaerolineae bacterium]
MFTEESFLTFNEIIGKPLYYLFRPVVQQQIIAIVIALLVAWLLARRLRPWLISLLPLEQEVAAPEPVYAQEFDEAKDLPTEKTAVVEEVKPTRRQQLGNYLVTPLPHLVLPGLSLITVFIAWLVVGSLGGFVGLIDQFEQFLWLVFAYELILGLLYAAYPRKTVRRYHKKLLRPLFIVFIIGSMLNWIIDLNQLGQVVVFELFGNPVDVRALFLATVGVYLWLEIVWGLQELLQQIIDTYTDTDPATIQASLTLTRYVLIGIFFLFVFSEMQLSPTVVTALTGGLSAGFAFGSKDVVNNFISGIMLLFERSVRPGDVVEIDGTMGVVSAMNIRSTIVQGFDGREVIVPNEKILTSSVTTYTKSSRHARIKIDVGVSYDADLQKVLEILTEIPRQHPLVLDEPAPSAFLMEFGPSSVNFSLFAWVADLGQKVTTQQEMVLTMLETFARHNIEIPLPLQDIRLRDVPWEALVVNGKSTKPED